jgi:hypothetical protein
LSFSLPYFTKRLFEFVHTQHRPFSKTFRADFEVRGEFAGVSAIVVCRRDALQ